MNHLTPPSTQGRTACETALAETERALNASESQLAAVIDAAMDAIVTVDERGAIVVFNESAARMFGCGRAQAQGAHISGLLPQVQDFLARSRGNAAPADGAPRLLARALAVQGLRAGSVPFQAEASVSRIVTVGGTLFCMVLRDVSEALAAEEARQALEFQLRQSQKMEALGTLAGGIAHDFNNIVAAILGNAALALARADDSEQVRTFVSEITKAGLRARDVVQRIMAFSRNQPTVFTCQPLQPLVQEGVHLLRAMLPSGIDLVDELPDAPIYVRADATQISQVLMNLGTNAWQALGSHPGRVAVRLDADDGQAHIRVSDNGCGMDEDTVHRIFEPFFTTKPKGEGTGLGLPVVHGIVHAHGGRIGVTSTPGEGTTFDIYLPLVQPPAEATPTPDEHHEPVASGGGRHVVYLDDYPAMVFMMEATLQALGYRVSGFQDATEALAWLRDHAGDVDLVVTDFNMPAVSGLELARELARMRPTLPVILASGLITPQLRAEAARAGVRHLFDKPRGIEELCDLIAQVLRDDEQDVAAPRSENVG